MVKEDGQERDRGIEGRCQGDEERGVCVSQISTLNPVLELKKLL